VLRVLLWGFAGTTILTILLRASQAIGLTRMDLPLVLGLAVTPDRDRAKAVGILIHMVNGWLFALIYALLFHDLDRSGWLIGAIIGAVHGMFVLLILLPSLPGFHPRMATDGRGPEPTRELEPPGFLGLNYGRRTPFVVIVAHMIFGVILGVFYA
jgi:uncharacterized membrane protein YagU involved in acid resistance